MMRLALKAALLVVFYVLTSAATVYAECAWVLWMEEIETVTRAQNPPQRVMHKVSGPSVDFSHFDSDDPKARSARFQRFNYTCLPDTWTPRGARRGSERPAGQWVVVASRSWA
jgi:hypothetical protein